MRLGYTIIYVSDVAATVEFYERAFAITRRFLHESGEFAEMETGATALAFAGESLVSKTCHSFRRNRPEDEAAGAEVGFVTDDVPAAFAHAIEAGAVSTVEPQQKP